MWGWLLAILGGLAVSNTAAQPFEVIRRSNAVAAKGYDALFKKYGEAYGISWQVLKAQATIESSLNPSAKNSTSSAKGLMQVTDAAAKTIGETGNQFDPETSIRSGAKYLRWLMDTYKFPIETAIRAYYAGGGTIRTGDAGKGFFQNWQESAYKYSFVYLDKIKKEYAKISGVA